jgi:hypothetical protein
MRNEMDFPFTNARFAKKTINAANTGFFEIFHTTKKYRKLRDKSKIFELQKKVRA